MVAIVGDTKSDTGAENITDTRLESRLFLIFLIAAAIYIVIFRVMFDIVGANEPEYYPIEVMTTIAVILTTVLAGLIFYEDRKKNNKTDPLYLCLVIIFFAFFLAENNWLLGREYFLGTIIYSGVTAILFLFVLKHLFSIERNAFYMFFLGMILLGLSIFIDAVTDHNLPITFDNPKRLLIEEIPDLYASLFFLYSMYLLYSKITEKTRYFHIDRTGGFVVVISAIVLGYGNTYLLEEHDNPIPVIRIMIGLIMYFIGISIPIIYFKYFRRRKQ